MSERGPEAIKTDEKNLLSSIALTGSIALSLDLQALDDAAARLRADVSRYEAIGILDGAWFIPRLDDKRARLERLEALVNLVRVAYETAPRILREVQ